jgi:hypothetical protein
MLTNKPEREFAFTISELEVWEVTGYILDDPYVKYDLKEIQNKREL